MMSAEERLERLEKLVEELHYRSLDTPIVVEGLRDVAALKKLGVTKNVVPLNKGSSVIAFSEDIAKEFSKAVILTDWDRKGGHLARLLLEALTGTDVKVDTDIRAKIVMLSKKEIRDIESLPSLLSRLRRMQLAKSGERSVVDG
jgi:dTMP kinase